MSVSDCHLCRFEQIWSAMEQKSRRCMAWDNDENDGINCVVTSTGITERYA